MGEQQPDGGALRLGGTVVPMYVDQSRDALDPERTVYQEIAGGAEEVRGCGLAVGVAAGGAEELRGRGGWLWRGGGAGLWGLAGAEEVRGRGCGCGWLGGRWPPRAAARSAAARPHQPAAHHHHHHTTTTATHHAHPPPQIDLNGRTVPARAYCSWYNFKSADQQKKVGMLSGGWAWGVGVAGG